MIAALIAGMTQRNVFTLHVINLCIIFRERVSLEGKKFLYARRHRTHSQLCLVINDMTSTLALHNRCRMTKDNVSQVRQITNCKLLSERGNTYVCFKAFSKFLHLLLFSSSDRHLRGRLRSSSRASHVGSRHCASNVKLSHWSLVHKLSGKTFVVCCQKINALRSVIILTLLARLLQSSDPIIQVDYMWV